MSRHDIRGALLRTSAAAALLASGATAASASTVVGGGSTLGGPEYQIIFNDAGLQTPPTYACTTSVDICYAFVGSGGGTTGFLNNDSTQLSLAAGIPVDFGGSDAILTTSQISTFKTTYGYQLIQLPAFGTPVALAFTYAGKAKNAAIKLSDDDICGIASGKIKDWSAVTTTTGLSGPIGVSYRQDSSGTSFLFTNHLGAVCTNANASASFVSALAANKAAAGGKVGNDGGTTKFATLFPGYRTGVSGKTYFVPAGTYATEADQGTIDGVAVGTTAGLPGNGSGGVQLQIVSNPKTIGYIGPDYTQIAANPTLGAGVTKAPYVASVIGPHGGGAPTAYLPNLPNTLAALASFKFTPVATNPDTFGVLVPTPGTGYPIVGYTNLFVSSKYSAASKVSIVKSFLNCLYNVGGTTCTTVVSDLNNKGFVPVPGVTASAAPTKLAGSIVKDYLAANATVKITSGTGGR